MCPQKNLWTLKDINLYNFIKEVTIFCCHIVYFELLTTGVWLLITPAILFDEGLHQLLLWIETAER